jgi:hypothetical protein
MAADFFSSAWEDNFHAGGQGKSITPGLPVSGYGLRCSDGTHFER